MLIKEWLHEIDSGRVAHHLPAFSKHFETVSDLLEVTRQLGVEAVLAECGVSTPHRY